MATTSTVEMFFIGNFADMDTDETDADNENPNLVLGTYDDLARTIVSQVDVDDDAVIADDEFATGDYLSYDIGAGPTLADLDSSSLYNADILLGDGSTMSVPVLVIQAANGDVFISEYPPNPLDGLSIQSISLVSLNTSDATGINAGASSMENTAVVCYAAGTLIETPDGPRPVEVLRPGDMVTTLDHGPQRILWCRASEHTLGAAGHHEKPVLIAGGALGRNRPLHDLIVSPQHRILVGAVRQLEGVFDSEAFAPAKALTELPGIRYMNGKSQIEWIHFACARHEVVIANGCLSESLLLGRMVVDGLCPKGRREIDRLFANAPERGDALNGPPARECLTVSSVKRRIGEHRKGTAPFGTGNLPNGNSPLCGAGTRCDRETEAYALNRKCRTSPSLTS